MTQDREAPGRPARGRTGRLPDRTARTEEERSALRRAGGCGEPPGRHGARRAAERDRRAGDLRRERRTESRGRRHRPRPAIPRAVTRRLARHLQQGTAGRAVPVPAAVTHPRRMLMAAAAAACTLAARPSRALEGARLLQVLDFANRQLAATAAGLTPQISPHSTRADGTWETVARPSPTGTSTHPPSTRTPPRPPPSPPP